MFTRNISRQVFYLLLTSVMVSFMLWQMYASSWSQHTSRAMESIMSRYASHRTKDYSKLIDLENFEFKILAYVCVDSSPFLLIVVVSAPEHFTRRETIRDTWGQRRHDVKIVFLLGAVASNKIENKLLAESSQHGDLLQGNFADSYRNLTYKHVMALKYVKYHCPKAKYVLKTDDDVFVNIYTLLDFLDEEFSPDGTDDLLFCYMMRSGLVIRNPKSKWYVSIGEYPDKHYPTYCAGYVVVYSPNVASKLYEEAQRVAYFWIDDVHVTGTLAKMTNLTHVDAETYLQSWQKTHKKDKVFLFGRMNLSVKDIRELWKSLGS